MEVLRMVTIVVLIVYPSKSSMVDKGPQTFEPSENHKRELKDEGSEYSLLYVPAQEPSQKLQQPLPTAQPKPVYEFRHQQESSTSNPNKEQKPQQYERIRPELHFVPLESMPQFLQQHQKQYAISPLEQPNVQKSFYIFSQTQTERDQLEKPLFTPAFVISKEQARESSKQEQQQKHEQQELEQLKQQYFQRLQVTQLHLQQQLEENHQQQEKQAFVNELQHQLKQNEHQRQLQQNQQQRQQQEFEKIIQGQLEQQVQQWQFEKQLERSHSQQLQNLYRPNQHQQQQQQQIENSFQKNFQQLIRENQQQEQRHLENQLKQKIQQQQQENQEQQQLVKQLQEQIALSQQKKLQNQNSQSNENFDEYAKLFNQQKPSYNFVPSEPKLQLVPYQTKELEFQGVQTETKSINAQHNLQSQPRQQFINIQFIATPPQGQTAQQPQQLAEQKKTENLQLQLMRRAQEDTLQSSNQGRIAENDLNLQARNEYDLRQYAPNYQTQPRLVDYTKLSDEIAKDKAKAKAQSEAIANSPPVIVNKHISITRHRPVHITRHVTVPVPSPIAVPVPHPVNIPVPQPYAVPVEIIRPFAIPFIQTQTIEVDKPVPFEVEKRVPVTVEKKVYYKVDRPVPVERIVPVEVTKQIPVEVPVHKPETLQIVRHVWPKKGLW